MHGAADCSHDYQRGHIHQKTILFGSYFREQKFQEARDVDDVVALFFQNLFSEVTAEVKHVFRGREVASPSNFVSKWRNHILEHNGANRSKPSM